MDQNSKDALVVWAGTVLGGAGGWLGSARLAAASGYSLGTWGKLAAGLIGAAAGGMLGLLADMLFPGQVASPGFYAMLGMGAMMGATLQAPLAALLALLELTANPNIILPGT